MAVTNYLWDEDNIALETDEADATIAEYTYEPEQYGNLISERRSGTTYQHHYDALGSTRMLTDENGQISDTFDFDVWGNELVRTGTTETPFQWVGEVGYYFDTETDDYYVRARTYRPTIARWTSLDPIDLLAQYVYALNSAMALQDPTGLRPVEAPNPCPVNGPVVAPTPCSVICNEDYLKKHKVSTEGGGGVICCFSQKCACVFTNKFPRGHVFKPGQCSAIDACGLAHERGHFPSVNCDKPCECPYRPGFLGPPADLKKEECRLRLAELLCLAKACENNYRNRAPLFPDTKNKRECRQFAKLMGEAHFLGTIANTDAPCTNTEIQTAAKYKARLDYCTGV